RESLCARGSRVRADAPDHEGLAPTRAREEQARRAQPARDRRREGPFQSPEPRGRRGVDRRRDEASALTRVRAPARIDSELEAGPRAHYDAPAYYTKTYRSRKDDVAFYLRLAQKHAGHRTGKVLEYGVGNGRIAMPIARAGFSVTGVDLSRPM